MKKIITTLSFLWLLISISSAQSRNLKDYIIKSNNLNDTTLINFLNTQISKSQFVMIGEQHGIIEAGLFTKTVYNLGQSFGFEILCIETDAVAANYIERFSKGEDYLKEAAANAFKYPYSIPFYQNSDDYNMFIHVLNSKGEIWGIDQTFMAQSRLNFEYLSENTKNKILRARSTEFKDKAVELFQKAIAEKDYTSSFIFQYSDELHDELMDLTSEVWERELLIQLKKTKEIYTLFFNNEPYKSNLLRSRLMKENFLTYYKNSANVTEYPKVVFKLGAKHVGKGLTSNNVYDIANLIYELAIINKMNSTHILLKGIKGERMEGNPFELNPIKSYDYTKNLPQEIQESISGEEKYFILDLAALRFESNIYSNELREIMFKYDILVLVNNTKPTTIFKLE